MPPKRAICSGCERPITTCLCDALVSMCSSVQVLILQHPKEVGHALGTAALLAKQLTSCQLVVGEQFQPELLLGETWRKQGIVLYPSDDAIQCAENQDMHDRTLIVLDGTWRKAKRLRHQNPWLQELPHLSLSLDTTSNYRIRKTPREDGLSTIEATVAALNTLDKSKDYAPLLGAFEKMIDVQIKAMGEETFAKNYD